MVCFRSHGKVSENADKNLKWFHLLDLEITGAQIWNRAKNRKFGLVRTFKNDFFKNLFLQKLSPSNSEQVWKMIWMVKINSLTSRQIFHDFSVIFPVFRGSIDFFEVDFSKFFKFVHQWSRDLAKGITSNFCQSFLKPSHVTGSKPFLIY